MLYQRYSAALFNYCIRLTGDRHYAEDIVIETYTKLARSHLNSKGSIKAWLYRVATNASYRLFRRIRNDVQTIKNSTRTLVQDHGPKLIQEMYVQKLLDVLPDQQRIVITLKFYENMKYKEIADILCCPVGTVKSRMHEGLKNLRRRLHEMRQREKAS
jgi:RNA polymerase sigma-70 factor (ECF subfamily)